MKEGENEEGSEKGEEGVERKGVRKVKGKRYRNERRNGLERKEEGMVVRKDEV
jgi:hypothetical protein